MEIRTIIDTYPQLFHMAEAGSWNSISEHGLLSTSALLDLFEVQEPQRSEILQQRRPASVRLKHKRYGEAVVRDQIPLSEKRLTDCLTDMTFTQWLEVLNSRVFFWLTEEHLETLLGARAYRDLPHDVFVIDTERLLDRHADAVTLSPINSGATMYKPPARGSETFLPISEYAFEERKKARGKANAIVELAVDHGVLDIRDVANRVERRQVGVKSKLLWKRES
ncbi:MAG: hypothetical protein J0H98_02165 [Solirubrobacterales bacterium]|nr:hypothetical protein [Solirubrobacterales bacterium]